MGTPTLPDLIGAYLSSNEPHKAVAEIESAAWQDYITSEGWELIFTISQHLTEENLTSDQMLDGLTSIVRHIAEKADPKETLLGLQTQLECCENEAAFHFLLPHLQNITLNRMAKVQAHFFCTSEVIQKYLERLPLVSSQLEGEEKKFLDLDPDVQHITRVYSSVVDFYLPFVEQGLDHKALSLLGNPLISVDLTCDEKTKSQIRLHVEKIVGFVTAKLTDVCKPLNQFEDLAEDEVDGSHDAIAHFYYLLFAEDIGLNLLPQVYRPDYLLCCVLCPVTILLKRTEPHAILKGLLLYDAVVARISPRSLSASVLQHNFHAPFLTSLVKVIILCNSRECRQLGVKILRKCFGSYEYHGCYRLFAYFFENPQHSGLLGYVITLLKDIIVENFMKPSFSTYFQNDYLQGLLQKTCFLKHGAESDMLELNDELVSNLNLIRYLVIQDRGNITGIWNMIPEFVTEYLSSLKTGLTLSRAHYQLKLNELDQSKLSGDAVNNNISITVGNQVLPALPPEKQREIILEALTTFDMIESLSSRVNECIHAHGC